MSKQILTSLAYLKLDSVIELTDDVDDSYDRTANVITGGVETKLLKQHEDTAIEDSRNEYGIEEVSRLVLSQAQRMNKLEEATEAEHQGAIDQAAAHRAAFAEKEFRWAEDEADLQAQVFESEARALNAEVEAAEAKKLCKSMQCELAESKRELANARHELAANATKLEEQNHITAGLMLQVQSLAKEQNRLLERLEAKDVLLEVAQRQMDDISFAAARTRETLRAAAEDKTIETGSKLVIKAAQKFHVCLSNLISSFPASFITVDHDHSNI